MSARVVDARGRPFSRWGRTFRSADSAYDEIIDLRPSYGPTILRVEDDGETDEDVGRVVGDWLCDPGSEHAVRRIPRPKWRSSNVAERWSASRTWLDAWEQCDDAAWMIHAAMLSGVDSRSIARALVSCARTSLPYLPERETRPAEALEALARWALSTSDDDSLVRAERLAEGAENADLGVVGNSSAAAVGSAATAIRLMAVRWEYVASADALAVATYAATAAADALAQDGQFEAASGARERTLAVLAELVRGDIPTLTVLRAVAITPR